eukprot:gene22370-biopygen16243
MWVFVRKKTTAWGPGGSKAVDPSPWLARPLGLCRRPAGLQQNSSEAGSRTRPVLFFCDGTLYASIRGANPPRKRPAAVKQMGAGQFLGFKIIKRERSSKSARPQSEGGGVTGGWGGTTPHRPQSPRCHPHCSKMHFPCCRAWWAARYGIGAADARWRRWRQQAAAVWRSVRPPRPSTRPTVTQRSLPNQTQHHTTQPNQAKQNLTTPDQTRQDQARPDLTSSPTVSPRASSGRPGASPFERPRDVAF